ncbi:MAG: VanZ family protein [Eubacterium sp.]|nr:VanZ family protein [Eubacterium sp.]
MARVILLCLSIWWMITIFDFSAATARESSSLSDGITKKIVEIIEPDFSNLSEKQQEELFDRVSFFVRKTGHFGEYAILGLFIGGFLLTFEMIYQNIKNILISEGFGVLYAITDEFHQGFVDGRSPQVRDVVIDSTGFLLALLFIIFLITSHQRMRKNNFEAAVQNKSVITR